MDKAWESISMVELSDWQWGIGAGGLIALLIIGGLINRQQSEPKTIKRNDGPSLLTAGSTEPDERAEHEQGELNELRQQLQARDSELRDAQEEAELTLLQLHQVQEELEQLFLQNQAQARDSESDELNELRKQLQARDSESNELNELRQQLQARDSELKDSQEEAELTLLQLHQVQEELEYYFLESRKQASSQALTSAQLDQLQRIKQRLIHQLKVSSAQDNPAFKQIVRRQQNALHRFQRLHQKH